VEVTVSRWGEYGPRPEPNHDLDSLFEGMTASVEVPVSATADAAWGLVSDIGRIGEFSPECVEAHWLPGQPARVVGGVFEGRNRVVDGDDAFEWIRPCSVGEWEPPTRFAWTVGDRFDGTPASSWAFTITPTQHGVLLRQEFAHVPDGLSGLRAGAEGSPDRAAEFVRDRLVELCRGMAETLARMRDLLESSSSPA
jgi:uncharacterized protein YndB with AHSA1/START domain